MSAENHTIRVTGPTLKVLSLFLERHPTALSGADIINEKHILSGTLYPLLDRLTSSGFLCSKWEEVDPSIVGRPKRRLYNLTADGVLKASRVVQEHGISVPGKVWTGKAKKGYT